MIKVKDEEKFKKVCDSLRFNCIRLLINSDITKEERKEFELKLWNVETVEDLMGIINDILLKYTNSLA